MDELLCVCKDSSPGVGCARSTRHEETVDVFTVDAARQDRRDGDDGQHLTSDVGRPDASGA